MSAEAEPQVARDYLRGLHDQLVESSDQLANDPRAYFARVLEGDQEALEDLQNKSPELLRSHADLASSGIISRMVLIDLVTLGVNQNAKLSSGQIEFLEHALTTLSQESESGELESVQHSLLIATYINSCGG